MTPDSQELTDDPEFLDPQVLLNTADSKNSTQIQSKTCVMYVCGAQVLKETPVSQASLVDQGALAPKELWERWASQVKSQLYLSETFGYNIDDFFYTV